MSRQLCLFPELVMGELVNNLDEEVEKYIKDIPSNLKDIVGRSFKCGALMILGDIIDLLKKYTDLHES